MTTEALKRLYGKVGNRFAVPFSRGSILILMIVLVTTGCQPTNPPATTKPVANTPVIESVPNPTNTPIASTDVETPPPTAAIPTPANTPDAEGDLAPVEITFIDNAGFLIAAGVTKVLIDALYEGNAYISSPPDMILQQAIEGDPPFDGVDLLLITHDHPDH